MMKGAKMVKQKESGWYPKYELISSHTCRRWFATNLYKIIPAEHAEKFPEH